MTGWGLGCGGFATRRRRRWECQVVMRARRYHPHPCRLPSRERERYHPHPSPLPSRERRKCHPIASMLGMGGAPARFARRWRNQTTTKPASANTTATVPAGTIQAKTGDRESDPSPLVMRRPPASQPTSSVPPPPSCGQISGRYHSHCIGWNPKLRQKLGQGISYGLRINRPNPYGFPRQRVIQRRRPLHSD